MPRTKVPAGPTRGSSPSPVTVQSRLFPILLRLIQARRWLSSCASRRSGGGSSVHSSLRLQNPHDLVGCRLWAQSCMNLDLIPLGHPLQIVERYIIAAYDEPQLLLELYECGKRSMFPRLSAESSSMRLPQNAHHTTQRSTQGATR